MPNEYAQAMEGVRELEAFAAVVYSSNYELESVGHASGDSRGAGEEGQQTTPPGAGPGTERGRERERGRGREQSGEREEEEAEKSNADSRFNNITDQATSIFENVWGKVVG